VDANRTDDVNAMIAQYRRGRIASSDYKEMEYPADVPAEGRIMQAINQYI
jgi:hypothetical protein